MELDKNIKQQLAELLAEPAKVSSQHTAMLNNLLQEYPYYQPLRLLLAKANIYMAENDALAKASLYTNGQLLHQFLYKQERKYPAFSIVSLDSSCAEAVDPEDSAEPAALPEIDEVNDFSDYEIIQEAEETPAEGVFSEESDSGNNFTETVPAEQTQQTDQQITQETPEKEQQIQQQADSETPDQEVFEEINEVDLNNYRPFRNTDPNTEKTQNQAPAGTERRNSLEDDFVFESIASTDFFAFEENFSTETAEQPAENTPAAAPFIEEHEAAAAAEVENSQVSNYHDEKLPYTFLWWLAKTRKEHQSIFQPYAVAKKGSSQELQQQYVEHIFHIQSHLTGSEALLDESVQPKAGAKDAAIIENFIKKDPQITPPHADQIDNENKAKKSAEDQNDLVSETLANIYIEQMLYDKAIDTYEKLSLKFPEKRRYFADLIQSIEKKI